MQAQNRALHSKARTTCLSLGISCAAGVQASYWSMLEEGRVTETAAILLMQVRHPSCTHAAHPCCCPCGVALLPRRNCLGTGYHALRAPGRGSTLTSLG